MRATISSFSPCWLAFGYQAEQDRDQGPTRRDSRSHAVIGGAAVATVAFYEHSYALVRRMVRRHGRAGWYR
jgi:hypothetical protein